MIVMVEKVLPSWDFDLERGRERLGFITEMEG